MRIGIITVSFPTLSETFISNKVLHLAKRGHKVNVFCDSVNMQLFNTLFAGIPNVEAFAFSKKALAKYAALHPLALLKAGKAKTTLKKSVVNSARLHYIKKYDLDIIHAEFSGIGVLFLPVFKQLNVKTLVSCRGSAEKVKLLVFEDRKEKVKELFNEVNAIHCVSDDMRQTVLPYCSAPSKIFVNRPSIDEDIFKRTQPYPSNNVIQILSIGRFTFQKGYLTGLLAIKKLKESFTNFSWIIVGDGPQREEIIFHIHQMQLQDCVQLVGAKNRSEILDLYNTTDIFFLPSVYEGIANVALEAMSMQLPIVATKSGGMDEVITHNHNGLLADVYDSETLAAQLLQLVGNKQQRLELGLHARAIVKEGFTIAKQVDIFEAEYKKLLSNHA